MLIRVRLIGLTGETIMGQSFEALKSNGSEGFLQTIDHLIVDIILHKIFPLGCKLLVLIGPRAIRHFLTGRKRQAQVRRRTSESESVSGSANSRALKSIS